MRYCDTIAAILRRPHSTYQKVVQGKCPLHLLHFNGAVCSNTLFSNTSALTNSLLFRANSTCKGSRTPRFVKHFWVPILGAACSNKLFVGTLRPSQIPHIAGSFFRDLPLVLSLTQAHLCDTLFCNISRDNCAISRRDTSTQEFCDTIATSFARYEEYRYWASKPKYGRACNLKLAVPKRQQN